MRGVQNMKKIDMHAHVLPGIDDGAKTWDACLEMLKKSAENGVDQVIATPHYLPWKKSASPDEVRKLCIQAKEKLFEKHGIAMDIYPGNEIYYNVDAIQNLKKGLILTLAESRYVLVEFDTGAPFQVFCRAIKDFQDERYIPIIAHVERYGCLRQPEKMRELKEMGALFQMNIRTIQGGILDANSRWAKKRLKKKEIDFLASDMHDATKRSPILKEELYWVQKTLEPQYQKALLYKNVQRILDSTRE